MPSDSRRRHGRTRRLIILLAILTALLTVSLIVGTWVLQPFRIVSPSMEPTLFGEQPGEPGDTILVNRLAYLGSCPDRWDVVVFRAVNRPSPSGEKIIKRVVGLPGEVVRIEGGEIIVDGKKVAKPPHLEGIHYVRSGSYGVISVKLGPDELFVLGDNSYPSVDSRRFGPLPRDHLLGKGVSIVWPLSRAGRIR